MRFLKVLAAIAVVLCFVSFASAATYNVTFEWNANTEPDLAGYRLYMSSTSNQYTYGAANAIASVGSVTTAQVTLDLPEGAVRYFVLTAFDSAGNESGPSNQVSWTAPDVTPPSAPSNFFLKLWAKLLAWLSTIRL